MEIYKINNHDDMKKQCTHCNTEFDTDKSLIFYCTSTCKSRDRFLYLTDLNDKKYRVWKDNYLKFKEYYADPVKCKYGKQNLCLNCETEYIGFRKTCSKNCAKITKEKSTEKSTGAKHNLSKNSICIEERKNRLKQLYNIENIFQLQSVKNKIKNTIGCENISQKLSVKIKKRKTFEDSGAWTKLEDKSAFEIYCHHVTIFTNLNLNRFAFGAWYKDWIKDWSFFNKHVDHIYSKFDGFKNKIPAHIIGSFINLQFVDYKVNLKKGRKSEITLDELLKSHEIFEKTNLIRIKSIYEKAEETFIYHQELLQNENTKNTKNNK